ncbi:MAG: 16S rRNA (guanine(966)-N(2))-methyltransferase RsmD [Acholeplasmataceae bacterium]|nr:16S rRNA (guanine(966)-N(2))-methyltransferase RsmD [Acholeplasmataceae bacterium]
MRVIGGYHKGRILKRVGKKTTRETADMVKESVFNMIAGRNFNCVLDLFAGSGAYGLEALSRGAKYLYAVDHDKDAIKCVFENARILDVAEHMTILERDYKQFLKNIGNLYFDLVFIDPPYDLDVYDEVLNALNESIEEYGLIVVESKKQKILNETYKDLVKIKEKTYGIKRVTIYEKIID